MNQASSDIFETELTLVDNPEARMVGPWRRPAQMLAEQVVGGRASIHDEETARKAGFQGGAIEGPTHFSQLVPLGHELFGDAWHERGCISAHYQNACVEGEEVQAWAEGARDGSSLVQAGMQKRDGTPVLSASLSVGPEHPETELDELLGRLRPADSLVILRDMSVGMKGAETERVAMSFDQQLTDKISAGFQVLQMVRLQNFLQVARSWHTLVALITQWEWHLIKREICGQLIWAIHQKNLILDR